MLRLAPFKKLEANLIKISAVLAVFFLIIGMYYALVLSPPDYQQGEFVRIMYVHVPSAWMALGIYSFIGITSAIYIVWRNQLMDVIARNSAMVGSVFAFITLSTGSLWGKPIWGTWWVWDSRLTSMLILFFFYLGYMALCNRLKHTHTRSDAPAILAIVGLINIPIVKFSVNLWTTLHQPASIMRLDGPTIHKSMLLPLALIFTGCVFFFIAITAIRVRTELIRKKLLRHETRNFGH